MMNNVSRAPYNSSKLPKLTITLLASQLSSYFSLSLGIQNHFLYSLPSMSICIRLIDFVYYKGVTINSNHFFLNSYHFLTNMFGQFFLSFSVFNFMNVKHEIEVSFRANR
jgi:hypothetical protein